MDPSRGRHPTPQSQGNPRLRPLLERRIRYAERMEVFGPNLGMPHARAMGEGLFELRIRAAEGIARVFYCTVLNRRIVFLHQFVKKTDKIPSKELEIARRRLKEMKDAQTT